MDSNEDPSLPFTEKPAVVNNEAGASTHVDVFRSAVVPTPKKHPLKLAAISFVAVVLLVVIGFGIYKYFSSGTKASPKYKSPAQTVANAAVDTQHKTSHVSLTQSYTATDFNLSFNYPDGWVVVNNGSGPMTVTSPAMQLTSATGQKVSGLVIMTIQAQGQLPASFSAGTDLAVLNSQVIHYTQPTTSQTSQTYLSFVQYSSTNTKGGLDAIYVTGNYGYQKDQVIPDSDIASISPLVTVTFTKCGNKACTANLSPLTLASTSWNNSSFQAPIKDMLASLAFQ